MKKASLFAAAPVIVLMSLLGRAQIAPQHTGPNYGGLPSGVELDRNSRTYDNTDGNAVRWTDRWNQTHTVVLHAGQQVTVQFPIAHGGSWVWYDDDQERTGFNEAVTWIEAQFSWNDGDIRIMATGHRAIPASPGLIDEIGGALSATFRHVREIVQEGGRTVAEVQRIARAANLRK